MRLDRDAARARARRPTSPAARARPSRTAAAAVLALATENMVGAIEEITINQGIDPRYGGAASAAAARPA